MSDSVIERMCRISGDILLRTGLHIGGVESAAKIGGIDSEVICDPRTGGPIIPGSSLKGKIRTLLELGGESESDISLLFGSPAGKQAQGEFCASRAIFRDCFAVGQAGDEDSRFEVKGENTIDPFSRKQANPRFIERVSAGTRFRFEIILTLLTGDDETKILKLLEKGMRLLEDNYLGGHGSRGYGRVKFENTQSAFKTLAEYETGAGWKDERPFMAG
jgi:CRISPR-associated protein Csm3